MSNSDRLVRVILSEIDTNKDILIYTRNGMGQRINPDNIRTTSLSAKGTIGFKLLEDDEINGCYSISSHFQYLLYVTMKGKMRLNLSELLPTRESKNDQMVKLINLPDRDKLLKVIGVDDGDNEIIDISKLEESTMGSDLKKLTTKNAVSNNLVKVKII